MDIIEQVVQIIKKLSFVEEVRPQDYLQEDLSLDSVNLVFLLIDIENTFHIRLDESDIDPFALSTVQDVIDLVVRYVGDTDEEQDG